ncbi:hypothetical protein LL038_07480 [Clostridium estertheticum]|uniref:Uncharacterized protein n=1 Tax=Clostridium estertheticum TaxID=238834 RepID=A0AA47EMG4_9CLOT|nr:hypothetical protein [Clostridium estertheticum]MBU3154489.1 hypothetical protein [Clostridium estertheticum]WAG62074.1 hypothetical protein LL038_07480 [Clostridium estertheticum]
MDITIKIVVKSIWWGYFIWYDAYIIIILKAKRILPTGYSYNKEIK